MLKEYQIGNKYFNKYFDAVDYWLTEREKSDYFCESWFSRLRTIKQEKEKNWSKEALTDIIQYHCWKCGSSIIQKQNNLVEVLKEEIEEIEVYSDYWSVKRSIIEHIELANVLKSVRKIVGFLELGIRVNWVTVFPKTKKEDIIELPIEIAMGEYPVPYPKIDIVVGYAIDRAFRINEESEKLWVKVRLINTGIRDKTLLRKYFDIAEMIHIEGLTIKKGVLGNYLRSYRKWYRDNIEERIDYKGSVPMPEKLLYLWETVIFDIIYTDTAVDISTIEEMSNCFCDMDVFDAAGLKNILPDNVIVKLEDCLESANEDYLIPLKVLLSRTSVIINSDKDDRIGLFDNLWYRMLVYFDKWEEDILKLRKRIAEEKAKHKALIESRFTPFDPNLIKNINLAIEKNSDDITCSIEDALEKINADVVKNQIFPVIIEESNIVPVNLPDPDLVGKLKDIFRKHKESGFRISRGLYSGKLDKRRLYRIKTASNLFKEKEIKKRTDWIVTLLIDSSGSMIKSWDFMERMFLAIAKALMEYEHVISIFAYNEIERRCILTQLSHHNKLYSILPGGNTPSGEACIAAARLMEKRERRIIIHISDGLCNVGIGYNYAIMYCEKQKIDLITIGTGNDIKRLEERYGKHRVAFLENIEELPDVIQETFKRKFLQRIS